MLIRLQGHRLQVVWRRACIRHNILQYESRMKTNTEFYSFQNSHCFICWFVAAPSLPNDMAWSLRTAPDLQKHCSGLIV